MQVQRLPQMGDGNGMGLNPGAYGTGGYDRPALQGDRQSSYATYSSYSASPSSIEANANKRNRVHQWTHGVPAPGDRPGSSATGNSVGAVSAAWSDSATQPAMATDAGMARSPPKQQPFRGPPVPLLAQKHYPTLGVTAAVEFGDLSRSDLLRRPDGQPYHSLRAARESYLHDALQLPLHMITEVVPPETSEVASSRSVTPTPRSRMNSIIGRVRSSASLNSLISSQHPSTMDLQASSFARHEASLQAALPPPVAVQARHSLARQSLQSVRSFMQAPLLGPGARAGAQASINPSSASLVQQERLSRYSSSASSAEGQKRSADSSATPLKDVSTPSVSQPTASSTGTAPVIPRRDSSRRLTTGSVLPLSVASSRAPSSTACSTQLEEELESMDGTERGKHDGTERGKHDGTERGKHGDRGVGDRGRGVESETHADRQHRRSTTPSLQRVSTPRAVTPARPASVTSIGRPGQPESSVESLVGNTDAVVLNIPNKRGKLRVSFSWLSARRDKEEQEVTGPRADLRSVSTPVLSRPVDRGPERESWGGQKQLQSQPQPQPGYGPAQLQGQKQHHAQQQPLPQQQPQAQRFLQQYPQQYVSLAPGQLPSMQQPLPAGTHPPSQPAQPGQAPRPQSVVQPLPGVPSQPVAYPYYYKPGDPRQQTPAQGYQYGSPLYPVVMPYQPNVFYPPGTPQAQAVPMPMGRPPSAGGFVGMGMPAPRIAPRSSSLYPPTVAQTKPRRDRAISMPTTWKKRWPFAREPQVMYSAPKSTGRESDTDRAAEKAKHEAEKAERRLRRSERRDAKEAEGNGK